MEEKVAKARHAVRLKDKGAHLAKQIKGWCFFDGEEKAQNPFVRATLWCKGL